VKDEREKARAVQGNIKEKQDNEKGEGNRTTKKHELLSFDEFFFL